MHVGPEVLTLIFTIRREQGRPTNLNRVWRWSSSQLRHNIENENLQFFYDHKALLSTKDLYDNASAKRDTVKDRHQK